jgi:CBS domain-containing protein
MDLARNLKIESVSRLQLPPAVCVSPEHTVRQAVAIMQEHAIGCVLVCEAGLVVGIFTERDLLKRILGPSKPLTTPLRDCMTANPVTVRPQDPIGVALKRMQSGGHRHLPVVDEAGRPVSVLAVKRIVRYLVEHFPSTIYNLHPDPGMIQQEREGA